MPFRSSGKCAFSCSLTDFSVTSAETGDSLLVFNALEAGSFGVDVGSLRCASDRSLRSSSVVEDMSTGYLRGV